MLLLQLAIKDLFRNKVQSGLIILNIAVGIVGFVTLIHFKGAIQSSIGAKSKETLGADFGISARRPLEEKLVQTIEGQLEENLTDRTIQIETLSMVSSLQGKSRLVQIKAIEPKFPFYGEIKRDPVNSSALESGNVVWVYPEILTQLELEVGDTLNVGAASFEIGAVVLNDSASGVSTSMAPRAYIALDNLQKTQLITPQSLAWHSVLYKLEGLTDVEMSTLEANIEQEPIIPENIQVYTHTSVSEQTGRLLNYLSDYLGLAAIAALFLSAIGVVFLVRSYIAQRIKVIAIMQSLGFPQTQCFLVFVYQVLVLGILSGLVSLGFSYVLLEGLIGITNSLVSSPMSIAYDFKFLAYCFLTSTSIALIVTLPLLFQLYNIRPALVFSESAAPRLRFNNISIFLFGLNIVLFWLASMYISNSIQVGSLFFLGFLGSGLLLSVIFFILLQIIRYTFPKTGFAFSYAVSNLAGKPIPTLACFISLSLGLLLVNLVPQLEASLQTEMQSPKESKLPSLFMFDIQEEQVAQLEQIVKTNKAPLNQLSPMVRARLIKVNGKPFERSDGKAMTREQQRENRFRNRGFNLSYRAELSESEKILSGIPYEKEYAGLNDEPAEISIEQRFADRLDLKIGDLLTFDVQSIPVTGKIVNRRAVKWTSFQPNFFILFQPGVLEPAPKTYLASVGSIDFSVKDQIQTQIVNAMPNVSIIDVTRLVTRLVEITKQMSLALKSMAALSLLVGFLVLYSIVSHQITERRWDINLLKALGFEFSVIKNSLLIEFLLISGIASLLGCGLSIGTSYVISSVLFDSLWVFNWKIPLVTLIVVNGLTAVITIVSSTNILKRKVVLN